MNRVEMSSERISEVNRLEDLLMEEISILMSTRDAGEKLRTESETLKTISSIIDLDPQNPLLAQMNIDAIFESLTKLLQHKSTLN